MSAAVERRLRGDGAMPLLRAKLRVEVVEDPDLTNALAREWDELVTAAGASPFTGPVYGLTWWRHRGRGRLHIVTVRYADQLVALAPLHQRRIARQRVVRWLGHGLGTVAEVLVRPGYEPAAAAIWEHLSQDSSVYLDLVEFRDDGGGLAELRRSPHLESRVALRHVCPVVELSGVTGSEALLERLPRRNGLRRSVERARRRLIEESSTLAVEVVADPADLARLLPEIEQVYVAAEVAQPRLNLLRPPWRDFLLELTTALMDRKQATLFLGRIDGRAAAIELTIHDDAVINHWVSRFDPAFGAFSPGHLVMLEIFDRAIAHGTDRSDLLIGDGPHKLPWATASYDTLTVEAAAGHLLARTAALRTNVATRGGIQRLVQVAGRYR